MLWVSVECDLLFGLEDFFCLPPEFQSLVIEYNQQVQMGGMVMMMMMMMMMMMIIIIIIIIIIVIVVVVVIVIIIIVIIIIIIMIIIIIKSGPGTAQYGAARVAIHRRPHARAGGRGQKILSPTRRAGN